MEVSGSTAKKGCFVITNDHTPRAETESPVLIFEIAAVGWKAIPNTSLVSARQEVQALYAETLPSSILKQADEQSLVALLAIHTAIQDSSKRTRDFEQWGLVASPRLPGRRRIADFLVKFREQGAWSASPHVIPNCSLHSASGLLSQALGLHGPNFGAGGMIGSEKEALWAGFSLLEGEQLPGVWILFTGWDRESLTGEGQCQAAVLALRRCTHRTQRPSLELSFKDEWNSQPFSLESLGEAIRSSSDCCWNIGAGFTYYRHRPDLLEVAA